ncbi:MAG: DUF1571 domain-containing protein [Planctomycetia bacterium]|nr:DUF1571 domain-containing protein [Planctomycetia bacterium]
MATVPVRDGAWDNSIAPKRVGRRLWLKTSAALAVGGLGAWWTFGRGAPVEETGAVLGSVTQVGEVSSKIQGAEAIALCRKLLEEARLKLLPVQTVSAVFQKQERINDKLQPLNVMDVKVRRSPLAIYMKWHSPEQGQQIIWRDGSDDGKILVSPVGWKKKLVPLVKIAPDDDMEKAVSRRPVTNIGIWNFNERITALLNEELVKDPAVAVHVNEGREISGRPCYEFSFEHAQPSSIVRFKQVQIFIDRTLGVPVACEHYRWSENPADGAHLEESYLYRDLALDVALGDSDFDPGNPSLSFGVK